MRHFGSVLGFACLLGLLLAFAPAEGNAKKKEAKAKDKKSYPLASDADYKALQKQKELFGKLVSIDGVTITVRAEYPHNEPNPKYKPPNVTNPKAKGYNASANQQYQLIRTYQNIMREQQLAANSKTPQEYRRHMQRIAQDMNRLQQEIMRMNQQMAKTGGKGVKIDQNNQPFIVVVGTKDFDLELTEKVVFRKLVLPFEYDDVGKIKTYTDKEKEELRGPDKTKPGYMAKIEDLMPGAEVKLTLAAAKKIVVDKDAEKDAKAPDGVARPTVRMVVMTKEAPGGSTIQTAPPKKKKK